MILLRLRETVHFFWQHLTGLLVLLLPVLPLLVLVNYRFEVVFAGNPEKAVADIISLLLEMLAGVAATALTIRHAMAVLHDGSLSPLRLWRDAVRGMPSLIGVQLLAGLVIVAGLLLFILPGLYCLGALLPAYVLAVHEGLLPLPALRASWQRFRGQAWAVSACLCMLMLVLMIVLSGLESLAQLLDGTGAPMPLRIAGGAGLDLIGVLFTQTLAILLVRFYELEQAGASAG